MKTWFFILLIGCLFQLTACVTIPVSLELTEPMLDHNVTLKYESKAGVKVTAERK